MSRSEPLHWRAEARRRFPEHEQFIAAADDEYAIYNLFFELREDFKDAVARGETRIARKIIDFATSCLQGALVSNGEDIGTAAGVGFFEHLFDDVPATRWGTIFSCLPRETYQACRRYLERWMEPDDFAKVEARARATYD